MEFHQHLEWVNLFAFLRLAFTWSSPFAQQSDFKWRSNQESPRGDTKNNILIETIVYKWTRGVKKTDQVANDPIARLHQHFGRKKKQKKKRNLKQNREVKTTCCLPNLCPSHGERENNCRWWKQEPRESTEEKRKRTEIITNRTETQLTRSKMLLTSKNVSSCEEEAMGNVLGPTTIGWQCVYASRSKWKNE